MDKPYSTEIENIEDLDKYLGKEIGISEWFEMSQDKVVLRPENQKYDDIIVNPQVEELAIEGSCVALLRETI